MAILKACCAKESNLKLVPTGRPDVLMKTCKVCNCRHIELTVDPGVLGVVGASL